MTIPRIDTHGATAPERGRSQVARAVLSAGGTETTYARMGHGTPVLLLRAAGEVPAEASPLFGALAARFRVVAPDWPHALDARAPDAFAAWLRDFLDGLGLERVRVVADGALEALAAEFARHDPSRVGHVIAVPAGVAEPAWISAVVDAVVGNQ